MKRNSELLTLIALAVVGSASFLTGRAANAGATRASLPDPRTAGAEEEKSSRRDVPHVRPTARVTLSPALPIPSEPSSPPKSAVEERDASVASLQASGPDNQGLANYADVVGSAWTKLAEESGTDEVFRWKCYQAGCFATVVHSSTSSLEGLTTKISRSPEFHRWSGAKMRSGPIERPDGNIEVTWILFSPDDRGDIAPNAN